MTRKAILGIFFLTILNSVFGLYSSSSKVIQLTASNFKQKVLQSNELWFIEFYGKGKVNNSPLVRPLQESGPRVGKGRSRPGRDCEHCRRGYDEASGRGSAVRDQGLPDFEVLRE